MTELFQFVNGTFVPTNLPVPVLAEPNSKAVLADGLRSEHSRQARESINGSRQDGSPVESGNSRGGQNLFDGETYSPRLDEARLTGQLQRVRDLMSDSVWRTLSDISKALGDPESSISARLRDLRRPKHGFHTVKRRRRGDTTRGLFEYQVLP